MKMAGINPIISIIILSVNGQKTPPNYMLSTRNPLQTKTQRWKKSRWLEKNGYQGNIIQKKTGTAILISERVESKEFITDKGVNYIMIQGTVI